MKIFIYTSSIPDESGVTIHGATDKEDMAKIWAAAGGLVYMLDTEVGPELDSLDSIEF
jgi:hypothetical protein